MLQQAPQVSIVNVTLDPAADERFRPRLKALSSSAFSSPSASPTRGCESSSRNARASLRIPGFSRAEVGEIMVPAPIARPLGWVMGAGVATLLADSFTSDLYVIPLS